MARETITMFDIEDLHAALLLRYGEAWVRKWEHIPDTPNATAQELVRRDWLAALENFSKEALWYGMKNLPATRIPPNAAEFAAIAKGHYDQAATRTPRIAGPKPYFDPVKWKEFGDRFKEIVKEKQNRIGLAWAYDLQARHKRGEDLTPGQIDAYKQALREKAIEPTKMPTGHFNGIDERALPIGMCSQAERRRREIEQLGPEASS